MSRTKYDDAEARHVQEYASATVLNFAMRMDEFQVHAAIEAVWGFVSRCDQLVESAAPWKLAKDPAQAERLDAVLYTLAESLRILAILAAPVLPLASAAILEQLNVPGEALLEHARWGGLADGHQLGQPQPVFPRIETVKE